MVELLTPIGAIVIICAIGVGLGVGILVASRTGLATPDASAGETDALTTELANILETDANRQSVTTAVSELVGAVNSIVEELNSVENVQLPTGAPAEQAKAAAREFDVGPIELEADDEKHVTNSGHSEEISDTTSVVQTAAESVQAGRTPDSVEAKRLLEYLAAPETTSKRQLTAALNDVLDELAAAESFHRSIQGPLPSDPAQLADELGAIEAELEGDVARAIGEIRETLRESADSLETEREELSTYESATTEIRRYAEEAGLDIDRADPTAWLEQFATALRREEITLSIGQGTVATAAHQTDATEQVESSQARELLEYLSAPEQYPRETVEESLRETVRLLDEAETVRAKLSGLDAAEVEQQAAGVASDLESLETPLAELLEERVSELRSTIDQTGDDLTLYATRQELQFYDRILLPRYQDITTDTQTDAAGEIARVKERRSEMRSDYPEKYQQVSHEIPIHFFETVSDLLSQASSAQARGADGEAIGLARAGDILLDAIETLYEHNSYNVMLRQLRG